MGKRKLIGTDIIVLRNPVFYEGDMVADTEFLAEYRRYVSQILTPYERDVRRILAEWTKQPDYWTKYAPSKRMPAPSPVQRTHTRIKRPESVADKIYRKPDSFSQGLTSQSFKDMTDTLGARVVTFVNTGLPFIDREIRSIFELSPNESPVAYLEPDLTERLGLGHLRRETKASGYASVHYIVRLADATERPWFEIQVRTMLADVWGEIEHLLGYKPLKRTSFRVKQHFAILAASLRVVDESFNFISEELLRYQEEIDFDDEDILNAENLPSVLSRLGIGCSQREIDSMLKLLVSRGIATVGALARPASFRRIEMIRNTYRTEEGHTPRDFEVVASLAAIARVESDEEVVAAVKTHIEYLRMWDSLKKDRE
jgi:putative GTP pyrophosphokinase